MAEVKCIYCEYCSFDDPRDKVGFCTKIVPEKRKLLNIIQKRECKVFNLGPIDTVKWRKDQVRNNT